MNYPKPPTTYADQLSILKGRGLTVPDEPFALHCLEHLNYYRLSAYRFPLTVPGDPDRFQPGVTFDDLWRLYRFDRTMRRLVLDACKRVEISVRSRWAYELAHRYGPQAYELPEIFSHAGRHAENLAKLDAELARSQEDFVQHFVDKYGVTRPPIWAACEVMAFGQLSKFYNQLQSPADRQAIADTYDLDEIVLGSFLHHLSTVRNHAAHHGRIWNRRFVLKFQLPRKKPQSLAGCFRPADSAAPGVERKLYNTLVMLLYLMSKIEPQSLWSRQIIRQLLSLDSKYLRDMGFPADWKARPIWGPLVRTS